MKDTANPRTFRSPSEFGSHAFQRTSKPGGASRAIVKIWLKWDVDVVNGSSLFDDLLFKIFWNHFMS